MKKYSVLTALFLGLALTGCQNIPASGTPDVHTDISESETAVPKPVKKTDGTNEITACPAGETKVVQDGPYGQISLSLPEGWLYESCPVDDDELLSGLYGIRFYPEDADGGYISLVYCDFFGVCGTGLTEEALTIAGVPAFVGTYDNHPYWDFISFQDAYDGIVALTYSVDSWWAEYGSQAEDILDSMSFDTRIREGAAYVYDAASEISAVGLSFSLKNISPTGATLVFRQYDRDAPSGDLTYGDDFRLEMQKGETWESVPTVLESYGFNAVGYNIPLGEITEQKMSWEWIYGTLAPGSYRIVKSILASHENGFDEYSIYAYFILN